MREHKVYEIDAFAYSDIRAPQLPHHVQEHRLFMARHQLYPTGVPTVIRSQKILALRNQGAVYFAQLAEKHVAAVVASPSDSEHEFLTKHANARLMPDDFLDTQLRNPVSWQCIGFAQPLSPRLAQEVENRCRQELAEGVTDVKWSEDHANVLVQFDRFKITPFLFGDLLRSLSQLTQISLVNGMEYPVRR